MLVWFFEDEYEDDDDNSFRHPYRTRSRPRPRLFFHCALFYPGWVSLPEAKKSDHLPETGRRRPEALIMESKQKSTFQLVWGLLLLLAGIGVFFRIPQIMPEIKKIEHFAPYMTYIYFCFYLIGILLVVGGGRKVYNYLKSRNKEETIDR